MLKIGVNELFIGMQWVKKSPDINRGF